MSTREHEGRVLVDRRSHGGRCELCSRLGSNVHHRMRQGRPWHGANLLRVCGSGNASGCHGWIETHPMYAAALGLIVPRGFDPGVIPMLCHPVLFALGWWLPDDDGMWTSVDVAPRPETEAAVEALCQHLDAMADAL